MKAIDVEGLEKSYGDKQIYTGFDLSVDGGEIVGIKGRSGIGKTTLFRCITGLEECSGKVSVNGEIAYLFQEPRVFPWLNVKQNILMPLKLSDNTKGEEHVSRMRKLSERMGIEDHLDKPLDEISGGEKQRTILVRALVTDPDILLLDEPFKSLDEKTSRNVYRRFIDSCKGSGKTALIASHDNGVKEIADYTIDLDGSKDVKNMEKR